jgi:lysozyme
MIDLKAAAKFIAGFEGFRGEVYLDAVRVETIGYGETQGDLIERYRTSGISEPAAFELLERRVQEFADGVERCITNKAALTPNRHAALTSLAYNIGIGAFADSTACKRFNAGDMAGVPEAMSWWNKGGDQVLEGLSRRRAAEGALFARGDVASPGGPKVAPPNDPTPPAPAASDVPPWPGRLLQNGMDGEDVREAQGRLAQRGWGIVTDGSFGPKTDAIVRSFQTEKALDVDGLIGLVTWQSLWTAPVT